MRWRSTNCIICSSVTPSGGLADHLSALARQVLHPAAGAVEHERHLLAAHVGIRDDDVTVLPTSEHQALALQADPEHLLSPAIEHQREAAGGQF